MHRLFALFLLVGCTAQSAPTPPGSLPGTRFTSAGALPDDDLATALLAEDAPKPLSDRPRSRSYAEVEGDIEARRKELGREWMNAPAADKVSVRDEARDYLARTIRQDLIPPWYGTPWEFYGTSQTPGEGSIACGYFVSTVLQDAGLRVARVQLAQQASEHIVRTFADRGEVAYTYGRAPLEVVRDVKKRGAGLYSIGLDYHVGLLSWDGEGPVEMCHSSVLAPGTVICEDAVQAEAMLSHVHVLGPVLSDRVVEAWIKGKGVPTALP
ncbi:MAG: hypothetical protein KDA24_01470 [Deltaproteobacteria bacterium]|nr:hypothetical protein [Deltaproteobacteria bacterium]